MTHALNIAREPEGIAGNADRVSALAANVEALRARFGSGLDFTRKIPPHLSVRVPAEKWDAGLPRFDPPPPKPKRRKPALRLGVTCRACGADDWNLRTQRRKDRKTTQGRECRPCANERCKQKARRRAQRALAGMDGRMT